MQTSDGSEIILHARIDLEKDGHFERTVIVIRRDPTLTENQYLVMVFRGNKPTIVGKRDLPSALSVVAGLLDTLL